jgi:hypothetical protein
VKEMIYRTKVEVREEEKGNQIEHFCHGIKTAALL